MSKADPTNASPDASASGDLETCLDALEGALGYVYHALRRHGVPDADLDDLVQEVFLVMWRRWSLYDPGRPLRPWLAGIAFRVAYNHRQRAVREVPGGLLDRQDETPDPEQRIAAHNLRTLVRSVLDALPEKHRTLILLHDVDGISVRQIAEGLEIPIPTAHTRLRAARKAFAQALRRQEVISLARARLGPDRRAAPPPTSPQLPTQPRRTKPVRRGRSLVFLPLWPRARPGGAQHSPGLRPGGSVPAAATPRPPASAGTGTWRPFAGAASLAAAGLLVVALGLGRAGSPPPAVSAPVDSGGAVVERGRPARALKRQQMLTAILPVTATRFVTPRAPVPLTESLGAGLVGYWRFDEPAGSTLARDVSGHGNDCWLRGLDPREAWSEGQLGGGVTLSGRGWLECPQVQVLAGLDQEMTIALWVKRSGSKAHVRGLVTRQFGVRHLDVFHFGLKNDRIALRSRVKGGAAFGPFPARRGLWHHVAATLDREGLAQLYVDGELVASKRRAGRPPLGGGDTPLILGGGVNGPDAEVSERFRGTLDEVLIYDRPLGAAEIEALYRGLQPRLSP